MAFAHGAAGVISTLRIVPSRARHVDGAESELDLLVCLSPVVSLIIMVNAAAKFWSGAVLVDSVQKIVLPKDLNASLRAKKSVIIAGAALNAVGSVSITPPRLSIVEAAVKPVLLQMGLEVVKQPPVILHCVPPVSLTQMG